MTEFASSDRQAEADRPWQIVATLLEEANFETVFQPETAEWLRTTLSTVHQMLELKHQPLDVVVQSSFPGSEGPLPSDPTIAFHYYLAKGPNGINLQGRTHLWETREAIGAARHMVYPDIYPITVPDGKVNWPAIQRAAALEELYKNSPSFP